MLLKCYVDEEGELACALHFCVVGDPQTFKLGAKATCSVPRLLNFPEGCFEHAIQERPAQCATKRAYIASEVCLSFKRLSTISGRPLQPLPDHCSAACAKLGATLILFEALIKMSVFAIPFPAGTIFISRPVKYVLGIFNLRLSHLTKH